MSRRLVLLLLELLSSVTVIISSSNSSSTARQADSAQFTTESRDKKPAHFFLRTGPSHVTMIQDFVVGDDDTNCSPFCSQPIIRDDGTWLQVKSDVDGEAEYDGFGRVVSLSSDGNIMAVGVPHNDGSGIHAGHVRVYQRFFSNWKQLGSDIEGEASYDYFGWSVSLSDDGTVLAVGAPRADGSGWAPDGNNKAGHVRVFNYTDSDWSQLGSKINGEATGDRFGWSVSLNSDGTVLAIGASRNSGGDTGYDTGHVRVLNFDGSDWAQLGSDINGEAKYDNSGTSVSLSGDGTTLAVGAYLNDGSGSDSGQVRVYHYVTGGNWSQLGDDIDGEAANDQSGHSVSLSSDGTIVAIGAYISGGNAGGTGYGTGQVRVFGYDSVSWHQIGPDIDGKVVGGNFGYSVSLSGDGAVLAVGAPTDAGLVRVYSYSGADWVQLGSDIEGEAAGDSSGYSVALNRNGTTLAVGAPFNDGGHLDGGQVRVFQYVVVDVIEDDDDDRSGAARLMIGVDLSASLYAALFALLSGTIMTAI